MNEMNGFKDVTEKESSKFADSPLAKKVEKADSTNEYNSENYDSPIVKDVKEIIKNKLDGLAREKEVGEELEKNILQSKDIKLYRKLIFVIKMVILLGIRYLVKHEELISWL